MTVDTFQESGRKRGSPTRRRDGNGARWVLPYAGQSGPCAGVGRGRLKLFLREVVWVGVVKIPTPSQHIHFALFYISLEEIICARVN